MMFKKKLLASAMATAMVAGAVVSGSAQAVRVSETGAGQVLMASLYSASGAGTVGVTNLTVVNTSRTNAVKARIAFRSAKYSVECRDFILYLTPGDVWRGVVSLDAAKGPIVTSTDDSVIQSMSGSTPVWASATNPMVTQIDGRLSADIKPGDTCAMGHIEVVGAYAAQNSVRLSNGTSVAIFGGMTKANLYSVFAEPRSVLTPANNVSSMTPSRVLLTGVAEIVMPSDRALYTMTALREGVNAATAGQSTLVIANESYDVGVGSPVAMGQGMGYAGSDNITDIEHALATTALSSSYEHGGTKVTNMVVTYPTKYRHFNLSNLTGINTPANTLSDGLTLGLAGCTAGSPFVIGSTVAAQYGITSWDNSENTATTAACFQSPCPAGTTNYMNDEVNYISVNDFGSTIYNSTSGWFQIGLTPSVGCSYAGIPATGYSHRYDTASAAAGSVLEALVRDNK